MNKIKQMKMRQHIKNRRWKDQVRMTPRLKMEVDFSKLGFGLSPVGAKLRPAVHRCSRFLRVNDMGVKMTGSKVCKMS